MRKRGERKKNKANRATREKGEGRREREVADENITKAKQDLLWLERGVEP